MIRSLLVSIVMGCVASVFAWFIIPASTYIESALGIIILTFLLTVTLTLAMLRFYFSKRS
jgi:hypothetical protein